MRVSIVVWGTERRTVSCVCSIGPLYHRVDHPMNEYLNHFVAARNTGTSAALGELDLVPAAVHWWNLLSSGVLTPDDLELLERP